MGEVVEGFACISMRWYAVSERSTPGDLQRSNIKIYSRKSHLESGAMSGLLSTMSAGEEAPEEAEGVRDRKRERERERERERVNRPGLHKAASQRVSQSVNDLILKCTGTIK